MRSKAVKPLVAAAGIAALLPVTPFAQAADAEIGEGLARSWCAACHEVEPNPAAGIPDSPPAFQTLADDPIYTEERLRGWLWAPHPPMPDLDLTRVEIDSLVAYIQSLRAN